MEVSELLHTQTHLLGRSAGSWSTNEACFATFHKYAITAWFLYLQILGLGRFGFFQIRFDLVRFSISSTRFRFFRFRYLHTTRAVNGYPGVRVPVEQRVPGQ